MKSISVSIALFFILSFAVISFGQETKPSIAVGANVGLQHIYCDIPKTGVAPAGEGQIRFLLSDRINLALGLGYGQLSDGFSKRTFTTNVINIDLKANLYLLKSGKFRPYATGGIGMINHTYNREQPWAIGDPQIEGKPFWSTAFLFGGGFDFHLSRTVALTAMADYRFTSTDDLDGFSQFGKSNDGYLNARVGIVFLMGKKAAKPSEELIADRGVSTEIDDTVDDETADILRTLGIIEEGPTTPTAAPAEDLDLAQLEQRARDLQLRIADRERDIGSLQSQIQSQDVRIAELQRELAQVQQYPGDFSSAYQEGLRSFGSRNYDRAIEIFTNLRNSYPQHQLVSNCIYWVGESQFAKRSYQAAIDAFMQVFNYPNSFKLDDATLMLGRSHHRLGQIEKAKSYFNQVISQFPNSEYVPKARAWLQRL